MNYLNRLRQTQADVNAVKSKNCFRLLMCYLFCRTLVLIIEASVVEEFPPIEQLCCCISYILSLYAIKKRTKSMILPFYICELTAMLYAPSRVLNLCVVGTDYFQHSYPQNSLTLRWSSYGLNVFGYIYIVANIIAALKMFLLISDEFHTPRLYVPTGAPPSA